MSEFDESAILIVDGRGASEATTLWQARGNEVRLLEKYPYPNSLGVFYAGMTEMLGFQPLSDEWKVMGLAAYGKPTFDLASLIRCARIPTASRAGGSSAKSISTTRNWRRSWGRGGTARSWARSTRTSPARRRTPARRPCRPCSAASPA